MKKYVLGFPTEAWFGFLFVLLLWLLAPSIVEVIYHKTPATDAGTFGDSFGFINSLFGVVTTAFIFAGLWLQRQEIKKLEEEKVAADLERKTADLRARIAMWPWLQFSASSPGHLSVYNAGQTAANIKYIFGGQHGIKIHTKVNPDLGPCGEQQIHISGYDYRKPWWMRVEFYTLAGDKGQVVFSFDMNEYSRKNHFPWTEIDLGE